MSGYRLSAAAAAAESRRKVWDGASPGPARVPRAELVSWSSPTDISLNNGNNFETNRVSVAQWADRIASTDPLGLSATYACVNLIVGTGASLSATVYRPDGSGVKSEATDHPLYWLLKLEPNYDDSDYDFWEFLFASVELQGNAYAEKQRIGNKLVALNPVSPIGMTVRRQSDGSREYQWYEDGVRKVRQQDDMLHVRGFGGNRLKGGSTLSVCGATFRAALATDTTASRMFTNGALPSGALSIEERLSPEQRAELEQLLQDKFMGSVNAGRPMLLDGGLEWKALTITPEDSQLLDSRKFSGEEICRIFGVPPAMVGYGDKSSNWGTGKEVDVLGFIKFTLRKRLRRMERALMKQLLTRAERLAGMSIEFNLEGLLRGDSAGRAAFYQIMVRLGLMTRNEARRLENLPPVPGGDVAMVQMQDVPLSEAAAGGKDAQTATIDEKANDQ